jgi:galactokinase
MAIDLATEARFTPKPGSFLVGIHSDQFATPWEIDLDGTAPSQPEASLAAGLIRLTHLTSGGTVQVKSTLPLGAGLSSSAAFSVALLLALDSALSTDDPVPLARRCQEAEALAGSHVGLLDPLAICGAQRGHAVSIDFATLESHPVPIPDDEHCGFVIVHSETTRLLSDSPYAQRRDECDRAARQLGRALGRCALGDLSQLPDPVLRRRARHVVTECARVQHIEQILQRGNMANVETIGQIMTEGHRSLAEDYRVSTPEVDALVTELLHRPGVFGARMSGGGFGGCVIALCAPDSPALDPESHAPRRAWRISPSAGAARLAK